MPLQQNPDAGGFSRHLLVFTAFCSLVVNDKVVHRNRNNEEYVFKLSILFGVQSVHDVQNSPNLLMRTDLCSLFSHGAHRMVSGTSQTLAGYYPQVHISSWSP